MGLIRHIKNLLKGLGITGKHLGRHAVTVQYPEERDDIPERSRGIVVLLSDKETGELNCTACELCMRACPTAAIRVVSHRDENKRKVFDEFTLDNGLCCFCGLCEEACNFSALKMATKYEFSTLTKDELIWDAKKLQEVGLDVDYVDTRKKKKPKTAKPVTDKAAKPADEKPAAAAPAAAEKAEGPVEDKAASMTQRPADKPADAKPGEAPKAEEKPSTTTTTEEKSAEAVPSNPKTVTSTPKSEEPDVKNEDKKQGEKPDAGD